MSDAQLPELPRGIALAWGVAANPQRGPKREMSVERIVETAVELADAEGIGAVSMSAVASRLGFTPMSLYRYVTAKDDLLLLMQEEATGLPPEEFRAEEGWRAQLGLLFKAQVEIYLRHPWVLSLPITGSPVTPNSSAWLDASLESLAETPLSQEERVAVSLLVTGHSRFYGMVLAGYSEAARVSGASAEEVSERESALYDMVISVDEFPALREAIDAGIFTADNDPFLFGIARILDGVAGYIEELESGQPHEPTPHEPTPAGVELAGDKRVREAQRAVRQAERELRAARKAERQALREASERLGR